MKITSDFRKELQQDGYEERWSKENEDGIGIYFFVKAMLNHPNEQPAVFVAQKVQTQGFGFTEEEACKALFNNLSK